MRTSRLGAFLPDGYSCRVILNYFPDVVSLCVPSVLKLCARCQTDAQCFGGVCVPSDEGGYCAADCTHSACPATFDCQPFTHPGTGVEIAVCQPVNGSCVCRPQTEGQLRSCSATNEFGTCLGFEACGGDAGWQGCNASIPAAETCNGLDDDCDGLVDNDLPASQPCQNSISDVGTYEGAPRCAGDLGWVCDARVPAVEACNFQDDDCDGDTDEGFTSVDADCFGNSCPELDGGRYCFRACEADADCLGVEGFTCGQKAGLAARGACRPTARATATPRRPRSRRPARAPARAARASAS